MTAQRRQFLAALTLAAIYKAPSLSLWQMIGAVWRIFIAFLPIGRRADPDVYLKRNATCEACEIHFSPLATCGSPLAVTDEQIGCWCHTPTKNRLAKSDCWAKKHGKPYGWPEELRPKQKA